MKRAFRLTAMLLALTLALAFPALAAEPRSSAYISNYSTGIVVEGKGQLDIYFTITGTGNLLQLGASVVEVYKADGTWVQSFRCAMVDGMMAYNTFYMKGHVTFYGVPGTEYYARVVFYAKGETGSDSRVAFTTPKVA